MSKINELRRHATDAVRARRWDRAVQLYERVCELDGNNASYRNELGDIHLKMGAIAQAVDAFVSAAELYRAVGLTNNAVAVHKKILRHAPDHLDSLWGLGAIRLEQGLETEATTAFLDFLDRADGLPQGAREVYLNRCFELLEQLPGDPQILSRLETVFEHWEAADAQAQVLLAKATLAVEEGEDDIAEKYLDRARAIYPLIEGLPAWRAYLESTGGTPASDDGPTSESVAHEGPASTPIPVPPVSAPVPASGVPELTFDPSVVNDDSDSGFGGERLEIDDSELELGFDFSADDLPDADVGPGAGTDADRETAGPRTMEIPVVDDGSDGAKVPGLEERSSQDPVEEPRSGSSPAAAIHTDETGRAGEEDGSVDLLQQLLADGDLDLEGAEQRQIDTIAKEMEGQLAGAVDPADHAGQYDLGIVYMDMGLFAQAIAAFDRASDGNEQRLKALEMKGTCLLRLDRSAEAMAVFQEGLGVPGYPARYYLGLLYGVGACHEADGQLLEAVDYFERVAAVDERFQDVAARLASLQQLIRDDG